MQQHRFTSKFFRFSTNYLALAGALLMILFLSLGCAAQIGDACESNGDCPSGAVCDQSVADGFCTIRNCRIGECPSESVCVSFDRHISYCMRNCEANSDCREDHQCIEDEERDQDYCFFAD